MSNKVRKVVALYDVHVPHNINLSPVYGFLKDFGPTDVVIGGDFLNLGSISHWNSENFKNIGFHTVKKNLRQEFNAGKKVLQKVRDSVPKDCTMYFLPGNHEFWLYGFIEKYPQVLGDTLDFDTPKFNDDYDKKAKEAFCLLLEHYLDLKNLGYQVTPYMRPLKIGKIYFVHGHEFSGGANIAKALVEKGKKNVVGGHHHTHQVFTSYSPLDFSEFHSGVSVPCLAQLGPGYLKQPNTKWMNGFYCAIIQPNGFYHDYVLKIINNKLVLPSGKVYK